MSQHPATPAGAAVTSEAATSEADRVAAAVSACPGVVSLHAGGLRQVATYLPGRRITGVRLSEETIEVALVTRFGVPVTEVDAQVRVALAPYARGRAVDVHVADILTADDDTPTLDDVSHRDHQPPAPAVAPEHPGAR